MYNKDEAIQSILLRLFFLNVSFFYHGMHFNM